MDNLILYHGSRGGIIGDIRPISRSRCDFGKGFYMGNNQIQAKSLVANDVSPYIYTLDVDFTQIPSANILKLNGLDWAYFVLYNRGRLESVKRSNFYRKYAIMGEGKDFIVGPIADDNMARVIAAFTNNQITDKALLASLKSIDYGTQFVAKTSKACSVVKILSEKAMEDDEVFPLLAQNAELRQEGAFAAEQMIRKYRREGKFFDEILESIQSSCSGSS